MLIVGYKQVTRDWLLMEMGNTNLDDETFAEIAEAAGLPDCYRPQVWKNNLLQILLHDSQSRIQQLT